MNFTPLDIAPAKLLLDPNNYRFHDLPSYRPVSNRTRYAEPGVQDRALALLQTTDSFDLESLKDSIKTNTYVPLERVVVELFDGEGENARYLVVGRQPPRSGSQNIAIGTSRGLSRHSSSDSCEHRRDPVYPNYRER
jgi:hypothetical protein